jgi:hypothetical protein
LLLVAVACAKATTGQPTLGSAEPCVAIAERELDGTMDRAQVETDFDQPRITAARDVTVTVVMTCSHDPGVRAIPWITTPARLGPAGGWISTDGTWSSSAFVYPPVATSPIGIVGLSDGLSATARFGSRPLARDGACIQAVDDVRPVACGFNLVFTVPLPTVGRPGVVESLVAVAKFGADGAPLPAYVYDVDPSGLSGRATIAVRRPDEPGAITVNWDEMTMQGGKIEHPPGSFSFKFDDVP